MKISVLIPCHNEEKSIRRCVESCLYQTRPADEIVVVNDGSTDSSKEILESFGDTITLVTIEKATGNKSYAQEVGLQYITGDIFVATDGDTVLDERFIEHIEKDFLDDSVAAVSGYVRSQKINWLTACREIDYVVAQHIHKFAQSIIKFVVVVPGCAAAFRTHIFKTYIRFDHDTLTEDLDFTYKLHELGLNVIFNKKAIVYTQDPFDLRSYVRQMRRWYNGGWQNLVKHREIFRKPLCSLELSMLYIEGCLFPLLLIALPILNIRYFAYYVLLYLAISVVVSIYAAVMSKRLDLILYSPLYLIVVGINSILFIEEFVSVVVLRKRDLMWLRAERREITL